MPLVLLLGHGLFSLGLLMGGCLLPAAGSEEPNGPPSRGESNAPIPQDHSGDPEEKLVQAQVSTVGWDRLSQTPVVLLRVVDSGQIVPIWVGVAEARAIMAALQDMVFPRPMTHDLMVNLLSRLDAELEEVIVHDLKEGVYYGLLKLRVKGEEVPRFMDTRPSDGLALAVRTGAGIRLAEKILVDLPEYNFLAPHEEEQVVRAVGLTVVALTAALREEFELPERPGLVILEALGAAGEQGLRRGDLILEVNGATPLEPMDFLTAIVATPDDEEILILYWRDGKEIAVRIPPSEPPPRKKRKPSGQLA